VRLSGKGGHEKTTRYDHDCELSGFGFVGAKNGWSDIAQQLNVVSTAVPILFALSALQALLQTAAGSLEHYHAYLVASTIEDSGCKALAEKLQRKPPEEETPERPTAASESFQFHESSRLIAETVYARIAAALARSQIATASAPGSG
jgi:hypothetical protein